MNDLFQSKILTPKQNEVEITLFGPGVGECIVLHLGFNQWVIVDSCLDPDSREPISIRYLDHLGVDYKSSVKKIIGTHWHDDHIQGIARALRKCESAEFIWSNALGSRELFSIIAAQNSKNRPLIKSVGTGIEELDDVLRVLDERTSNNFPVYASASKRLYSFINKDININMTSLSPSSADIHITKREFVNLFASFKGSIGRIADVDKNYSSIVLWVKVNDFIALLGSDLVVDVNPDRGWSAVLNSRTNPTGASQVFKVPHHGSQTSHHDDVWKDLLIKKPLSMLTPFSRRHLPSQSDISRILKLTDKVFCTSYNDKRKIKRDHFVERTIKKRTISRRVIENKMGAIQVRHNLSSKATTCNLFGAARHITDALHQ